MEGLRIPPVSYEAPHGLDTCVNRLREQHQSTQYRLTRRRRTAVDINRIDADTYGFAVRRLPVWKLADPEHDVGVMAEGTLTRLGETRTRVEYAMSMWGFWRLGKPLLLTFVAIVLILVVVQPGWLWWAAPLAAFLLALQMGARMAWRRIHLALILRRALLWRI